MKTKQKLLAAGYASWEIQMLAFDFRSKNWVQRKLARAAIRVVRKKP